MNFRLYFHEKLESKSMLAFKFIDSNIELVSRET